MCPASFPLLTIWTPGAGEMLLLAIIALLLYGGELPQAARQWGRAFAEFRRHLSGIQRDFNDAIYSEPQRLEYHPPANPVSTESAPGEVSAGTGDAAPPTSAASTPSD